MDKDKYIEELESKIFELKTVINEVPGNFYWKDLDGNYQGCNDNVIQSLLKVPLKDGVILKSRDDLVGKNNFDVFCDELAETLTANDNLVTSLGSEQVFVESHTNILNKQQYYLSKKAPFYDDEGNIVGLIGSAHDITKQKKLELELEEALKKSMADSKAKEAFIDSLSHDIRTPLTGIIGLIDVIYKGTKKIPKLHENVVTLKSATLSFLDFFNEILATVEDIDINEPENEEVLVDLSDLLFNLENIFVPALKDKKLKFTASVSEDVPLFILARKHILVRILTNLIGNAIKFTSKGEINVLISKSRISSYLDISVKDTGIGIAKKNLDKIFDRFTRADFRNNKYKGNGLGLFMVAKYVSALNGQINVDSKVGKGSEFIVSIPITASANEHTIISTDNSVNVTDEELSLCLSIPPKKILIVEDNNLAAFALSNLLNEFNHDVSIADTGHKALIELKDNNFDMIFLDQDLPDANGIELLDLIRSYQHCKTIPILILSGHIGRSLQGKLRKLPCEGLFVKPMQRDQLIKIFNKFLGSKETI